MIDALDLLWASFDTPGPLFTTEILESLPPGMAATLTDLGLLVPAENASHVVCPSCAERHVEEVLVRGGAGGKARYFIYCPESLRVEVSADSLRQWQPDFQVFARRVKELLGIDGRARERVPNQLWRLGAVKWRQSSREVFIARGLSWPTGASAASLCACTSRPIVFIGLVPPPSGCWPGLIPAVIPLPTVMTITNGALELDSLLLSQSVTEADAAAKLSMNVAESELKATIGRLVEQRLVEGPLNEMLAAGVSQGMSTREIENDLADRGVSMDHSSVARRIQKVKGTRRPSSSRSILNKDASQPRDRYGKPISNAQPLDEE